MMNPNMSPFAQQEKPKTGPSITPATAMAAGRGGQQNPAYLQMRRNVSPTQTGPVITPAPGVQGDTVNPQRPSAPSAMPSAGAGPAISPPSPNGKPVQAGGNSLSDLYKFFASDLANQTKQAKSNAVADASARGVYYGTPLTGSEADIDTQYLRGLGQLQSGMYGNEQQNQLQRLALGANVTAQGASAQPPAGGPMDWSSLGALFGGSAPPGTGSTVAGQRTGPTITPAPQVGNTPPVPKKSTQSF